MTIDPAKPGGVDDPTLIEITRRLVETYRPERIYLFGSRARGSAGSDSDYDLLVVVGLGSRACRRRPHPGATTSQSASLTWRHENQLGEVDSPESFADARRGPEYPRGLVVRGL